MKKGKVADISSFSAYHGGTWRGRERSHEQECARGIYWPSHGLNSEFAKLEEVLVYAMPQRPPRIPDPEKVQHLRLLSWRGLGRELSLLEKVFLDNGVKVRRLEADGFPASLPNLMFLRDHFFPTPWGAVLGRMASPVRAGEEKWAQLALAQHGIALLEMIRGTGTFEGADALWAAPGTVLVGTGNRTNRAGFLQLKAVLAEFGVRALSVPLPRSVQHLLGLLQIVAPGKALVRTAIAGPRLLRVLRELSYKIVSVPETAEVRLLQGMNIVTLSPNRVIMPAGCPGLRELYKKGRMQVAAEVPIPQLLNAAGGIACATGILSRSLISG